MAIRKLMSTYLMTAAIKLQEDQSKEKVIKEINKARAKLANWIKPQ